MLAYIPYMDPMGHRQAELPQMALAARMSWSSLYFLVNLKFIEDLYTLKNNEKHVSWKIECC